MAVNGASVIAPECVLKALAGITQARGWKSPKLQIELGSSDGDGYLSVLYRVLVRNEDDSLSLMCKTTLASMEKSTFVESVFKSENFVYNILLPAMEEIAHLQDPLPWPRAYPTDLRSPCLVLTDMRPQGFAISKRGAVFDEKRCRLLVSQLARFHGAGMALDKLRPDVIADLKKIVDRPIWLEELRKVFEPFLKSGINAPDMITERFPEKVNKKLKTMFATYTEDFFDYLKPDPEGGNTIVHGDCHVNNILFQENEVGAAVGCRLIDFQLVRYAWPAPDLAIILLSFTEKATRDEHWDSLMRAYHDELQSTLRAAGIEDPHAVYPWTTFQRHLQRAARMAVCLVPAMVHVFNDDSAIKDVQDTLANVTSDEAKEGDGAAIQIKDSPLLRRRFGDVVQSLLEWGWL